MWRKKAKTDPKEKTVERNAPGMAHSEDSLLRDSPVRRRWVGRLVRWGWGVVGLLWALPTLLLVAAGSWWLWQEGWLWPWLALTGAVSLVGWLLAEWLRRTSRDTWGILVQPDPRWTPRDQAAWEKVEQLAVRLQQSDLPLDQPEAVLRAFYEVLATVAQHYRPDSSRPELEIPAPHVLRIVELVSADLRRTLVERVPGSHWLTLHDFYKLSRLATWFQRFYRWFYGAYRVAQLATNPPAALIREVRDTALGQVQSSTTEELKEGAISFCVRQAGRYAIQLYSGKVLLEDQADRLPPTRSALEQIQQTAGPFVVEEEPLRLLVLGTKGAGKALLTEMLWGISAPVKQRFWTKLLFSPPILRRLWRPEGLPPFLVADWPLYDPIPPTAKQLAALEKEALQTDLVLFVSGAGSESWPADRRWLDTVRQVYAEHPERNCPAILVVLTLPQAGTNDVSERSLAEGGARSGAETFVSARAYPENRGEGNAGAMPLPSLMGELRDQLALSPSVPVVHVRLDPAEQKAIQQKILEAIRQLLPEAERARYGRYYAQYHREERWQRLWKQIRQTGPQAGKLAAQQTPHLLKQASKALWQMGTRWFRKKK